MKTLKKPRRTRAAYVSSHRPDVERYVRDVLNGRIVAGKMLRAAAQRWRHDLATAKSRGLWLDERRADRVIAFIQCLKHTTGEFNGQRCLLQPWQKFVIFNLFGWKRRSDGFRRFREAFISMGRGNGKTPLAAWILLVLFAFDEPREARAEIKCAATERDQAFAVWREAALLVQGNRYLNTQCEIFGNVNKTSINNTIVFRPNLSTLVCLGGEGGTKDSYNLHAYVADELHAWREEHRTLLEKLSTAMGKRRQPLAVTITTAGDEKSEIWKEQHGACEKVLGGVYADDALFAFIAEIDPEDDPCDPACWPKANPNLGICVKPDYLIRLAEKARFDPAAKHILTRYHCNRMVLSSSKPITPEIWSRGAGPLPDLDRRLCHGGLDLGWRDDLAAFYLAFPITENGVTRYAFRGRCWIPSETPRELSREPWATWIRQGWLTVTDGNTTDPESILKFILECKQRYDLKTIALDPNNARSVATELVNARGLIVYEFYQTCRKYNEPTREFLRLLTEGLIQHGDDPLLSWAASNLILRHDASDYVMPAKHKSDDKIDPIVASLMAFSECLFAESASSVYEHRGVRVLE